MRVVVNGTVAQALLGAFVTAFNDPPAKAKYFGHKWLKAPRQSLENAVDALKLGSVNSKDVINAYVVKFNSFRTSDLRKLAKVANPDAFKGEYDKKNTKAKEQGYEGLQHQLKEKAKEQGYESVHDKNNQKAKEQGYEGVEDKRRTAATRKFFALAREVAALPPLAPRSALCAAPASSAAANYRPKPESRRRAAKRDSDYAALCTKLGPPPTRVRFL